MINQEASESDFIDGTIEKKGYRKRWVNNVEKISHHPFNKGVHMDTHHLISAEAVKLSKLGKYLIQKGYDINLLANLAGFPATLPGACQLRCQLHRGDHTYSRPMEEPYHDHVAGLLALPQMKRKIKACYGKTKATETRVEIHQLLDPISKDILRQINKVVKEQYYQLPLTKISHYFVPKGQGCVCQFDINKAKKHESGHCEYNRLHYRDIANGRNGEDKRYQDSAAPGNSKIITYTGTNWKPEVGQ